MKNEDHGLPEIQSKFVQFYLELRSQTGFSDLVSALSGSDQAPAIYQEIKEVDVNTTVDLKHFALVTALQIVTEKIDDETPGKEYYDAIIANLDKEGHSDSWSSFTMLTIPILIALAVFHILPRGDD